MANQLLFPLFRAFDSNGAPLAGGKVYTYQAGTSTPLATYSDSGLSVPNANPVVLDAQGYPTSGGIWLNGTYKIDVQDSNGISIDGFPQDNYQNTAGAAGAAGTFQMSTAGGTVDAITATYSPVLTLSNLTTCGFVASGANTSTTPTFAPDGLTAHTITKRGGQPLVPGDIPGALAVCILEYNSANTRWELVNPALGGGQNWVVAAGTADVLTATYTPAVATLYDGLMLNFRAAAANATTTPTFAPNGLTAHTITKSGGSALSVGNIAGALAEYQLRYNLANTRWELLNPTVVITAEPAAAITLITTTGSSTWTSPSDTASSTVFKVTVKGGGGGGTPGNSASGSAGGGGGAGGESIGYITGLAASTGYTATVGTGGAASGAGNNSTMVFGGTTFQGNGGGAAGAFSGNVGGAGGAGGAASGGTFNNTGADGGTGASNAGLGSGGTGGDGGHGGASGGVAGTAGAKFGGGGGGGGSGGSGGAGGAGKQGFVLIERVYG